MTQKELQLRAAIREALDQFIDPDDDTMPYCNRVDGGYTWAPADDVIDRLVRAVQRVHATGALNEIATRWDHGHDTLTPGCGLCTAEYAEVRQALDGKEQT